MGQPRLDRDQFVTGLLAALALDNFTVLSLKRPLEPVFARLAADLEHEADRAGIRLTFRLDQPRGCVGSVPGLLRAAYDRGLLKPDLFRRRSLVIVFPDERALEYLQCSQVPAAVYQRLVRKFVEYYREEFSE